MPRSDEIDDGAELGAALSALHPDAWRWALTCCRGDRELAMEALHDSYVLILERRARFAGRSSFKSFLFGVVRMTSRAVWRKALARRLLSAPIEAAAEAPTPPAQEASARTRRIDAALDRLSTRQRAVVELVLLHDFTLAEAAEALGVSRGSVSRHYALAKDRMRALLETNEPRDD